MFKVDILEDARQVEREADAFVEQTKQLLLQESTTERTLLSAAGIDTGHMEAARVRDEKAMREELRMKTGSVAVLTEAEVKALCVKYRLRLLRSQRYKGAIDALTGRKLSKFLQDIGDPSPEHSARERLFVMAPAEAFNTDIAHIAKPIPDPVLFYRHDSGVYAVVHKWGNDFTVFRRLLGAVTATAYAWRWFAFLTMLAGSFAIKELFHLAGYHSMEYTALGLGIFLTLFRSLAAICESTSSHDQRVFENDVRVTFSETAWNSHERPQHYSMLRM
jgi:hypothetical protein